MGSLKAVFQWVLRTMMKSKGETGVVQTLPKKDIVELNTQITAQRLMQNGIDPTQLKNADQVENAIIAIESRPAVQQGLKSTESAKIFDLEGKEIPKGSKIMGGKAVDDLPPPGSRGGPDDIAAPVQSSEETLKNMIVAENKKNIAAMKKRKMLDEAIDNVSPGFSGDTKIDAELVAEDLAERMGKVYDDLPTKERLDLYDQAYQGLTKKKFDPPEDMAQGGRAGYRFGIGPLLKRLSQKSPKKAYTDYLESVKKRAQEGDMKSLAPELGAVTATGVFINRRMKDVLENMKEKDMENNLKNFRKELESDPFYKDYPELKDKILENYTEKMFGEKRADGGRIGYANGTDAPSIKLFPRASGRETESEVGPGIKISERDLNYGITGLLQGDKFFGGAEIDKGKVKIDVVSPEGDTIFKDTIGKKDAVNFILGIGDPKGEKFQIKTDKDFENMQVVFKKTFNKGGIARLGFKDGMTRRTFLKILGGAMSIPIVGKFLKPLKTAKGITKVPIIKTENVPGKPEWFDQLVNKVILEGDDMTKQFATKDREIVHAVSVDEDSFVRVTQDLDEGAVRVEYESPENVYGDPVQMQYKKPKPDEGDPRPSAEFETAESGPVGRQTGPDDFDIDVDEVGGSSISDLDSDVSKLKEYATGKKPTIKEILQSKKRKDKAKAITEGGDEMIDAVTRRQGDYDPFASGGIARMLGE